LIPRQLHENGLRLEEIQFTDAGLQKICRSYTREAGVRNLEREIGSVCRKVVTQIAEKAFDQIEITPEKVQTLLGRPLFFSDQEIIQRTSVPGVATGLAWTPVGGEILFIEATRMPGKGNLILTGSLGEVMKESATTALSYLRSQARPLNLANADFEKHDIHIHVPAGATPKDGPSAGVTITVALASLLTGRLVRSDLAMTGEISLRGRVLPVGGIKDKVLAAVRAGIHELILPAQNRKDWSDVPADVRQKLEVHFVSRIADALKLALRPAAPARRPLRKPRPVASNRSRKPAPSTP
jgi:ATP-dependent Lon protease